MKTSDRLLLKREGAFVFTFTGLVSLAAAHFLHNGWLLLQLLGGIPSGGEPAPTLYAPAAYRVLMPAVIAAVHRLLPSVDGMIVTSGIDFVLLWAALWLLYRMAVYDLAADLAHRTERCLRIALTFLFAVTAIAWIYAYQRPETTPTALYLLVSAVCLQRATSWAVAVQLAWTVLQGFTRADVALVLGLAMVGASAISNFAPRAQRKRLLLQGLAAAMIAAGVQGYLQFIRFPHLSYDPGTPVIALPYNLRVHMWSNALIAIAPVGLPILYALVRRVKLFEEPIAVVSALAAALYIPLWFTVGSLAEVRIYFPFLLLLSPLAAKSVEMLLGAERVREPSLHP